MNLTKSRTAKLAAGFVGFAMALSIVAPTLASADTASDLQAQINSLLATISSLQAQLSATTGSSSVSTGYTFNTNLTVGSTGADVMNLQKVLNMSADTKVANSGNGSPGMETSYFGPATKAAVIKFQTKYGISPAAGYVGAITRAKLNSMGGSTVPPVVTPGNPQGGSLSVSAGSQPANSLAPTNAARLPFTTVVLTAGSSDVTVNSITVERSGLAQDAMFSGVVLLDSNGMQIGIAKTLNSNHQAMVGEPFVVKAGTSKTVTVAGNIGTISSTYAGQVASLNVVAVNTSASVSGSMPITGAQHTANGTLTLGTATMSESSYDPDTSANKEIGTTNYKFAGVRVTAGSAEQVRLWSIRWNQTGSASSQDLANIKVYVDGTAYDTTVSSDGKYYSASFSGGLLIDKGNSKDVYIQGDIVGSSASGRTIEFDIYKATDIYVSGVTYGYGITPTQSANGTANVATSEFTSGTPFFSGSQVTVTGGSATSIQKATSVAAQNVAVNVPNQVLGGFQTDIKGEPISVQSMVYNFNYSSGVAASSYLLTNVSLVDENGAIVAGPVDAVNVGGVAQKVTFTDTVTLPVGVKTYTLKGKLPSGLSNGTTIVASTTPSSDWSNITGQTTGNTITLSNGVFSMNTMTVKAAALAITVSATPSAQSVVPGTQGFTFANYQFDASQSGEDVRFSSVPLYYNGASNAAAADESKLTSCQLFDGSTALNTGSNVVNPSTATATSTPYEPTFTFDQQFTIPKGTVKTLALKCNLASSMDNSSVVQWGIKTAASITVTGVTSGNDVTETVTASNGQAMTVSAAYLTVTTDSNSPSYALAAAGTSGNEIGRFKITAANETVNLNKIGLKLTNSASSSASDLIAVSIWDGATQVGSAIFTGANTVATSTFTSPVVLTKDVAKVLTIKADFAAIGTSQPGTQGHLIAIDVNGSDTTGTEGTGAGSGSTINLATSGSTASTAVAGVRLFRSFPTFAKVSVPTNTLNNGEQSLLRFKVTANAAGDVGIYKFTVRVATTTATVTGINIRAYTDSGFSTPVSGLSSDGSLLATALTGTAWGSSSTDLEVFAQTSAAASTTVQVPAGATRYFDVIGTVASASTGASVQTQLQGDAAYPQLSSFMGTALQINNDAGSNNDLIWSPNATSTSVNASNDWTNGYGIVGLPSSNMSAEVLSK
ncbi:MAG: Beta-galactosidase [Parcubacteria bacterium C7867-006]|nr:MAG: Beta-galactosidase [Parcubacteria bacterium C7867-006]